MAALSIFILYSLNRIICEKAIKYSRVLLVFIYLGWEELSPTDKYSGCEEEGPKVFLSFCSTYAQYNNRITALYTDCYTLQNHALYSRHVSKYEFVFLTLFRYFISGRKYYHIIRYLLYLQSVTLMLYIL